MAWTDQARQASAEARRRLRDTRKRSRANWHLGGTPGNNPHAYDPAYRKKLAAELRAARAGHPFNDNLNPAQRAVMSTKLRNRYGRDRFYNPSWKGTPQQQRGGKTLAEMRRRKTLRASMKRWRKDFQPGR